MKVAITGSNGLIARHLKEKLHEANHELMMFKRVDSSQDQPKDSLWWDPYNAVAHIPKDLDIDAVIHLGGEPVASKRWNVALKSKIYASRVYGTRGIVEAMAEIDNPPNIFISASAVGYYGDRGPEVLTESSASGTGFLATVCRDWEAVAQGAQNVQIRTCLLRTGLVLAKDGGVLPKITAPFKAWVGGRLGDGKAYMAWIHIDDHVGAIMHLLSDSEAIGAYNLVGPAPATNREFTKSLGSAMSRPALLNIPSFALELMLGDEMAHETVLASQNAYPKRLLDAGFHFRYSELDAALKSLLL